MLSVEQLLRLKKYPLDEARLELQRIQTLSKDEFLHWQEMKKWDIVKYHHTYNPLYRKLVGKCLPDDWSELPIIKKKDLQIDLNFLISEGINHKDLHFGTTSGSSGNPLKFARDKFSHSMTWAIILDRYRKVGVTSSDLQARFFGIPLDKLSFCKERFKDFLMCRYRFVVFDISESALNKFVDKFRSTPFRYIYGYTNSQLAFARYLKSKGLKLKDLCSSLSCCIVTSEQCTEENKLFLEEVFGVSVYNEYGAAEVAFLAMTDQQGNWRLSNETLFSEVLDSDGNEVHDGIPGRLIFTNLFNMAMPFIRYEVGDIGAIKKDPILIQDYLSDLQGRLNDRVVLPSGKIAAGLSFYYISKYLMSAIGMISEYQVHQLTLTRFLFLVVMERELDDFVIQTVKKGFEIYIEKGLEVEVRRVSFIDRERSGKLKSFISHLRLEN